MFFFRKKKDDKDKKKKTFLSKESFHELTAPLLQKFQKNNSKTKTKSKSKSKTQTDNVKGKDVRTVTDTTTKCNKILSQEKEPLLFFNKNGKDKKLNYSSFDRYISNEYGNRGIMGGGEEEKENNKNAIASSLLDKLFSFIGPLKKSRALKKYKKKIKKETVDQEATTRRLNEIEKIPFLYFGEVEVHPMYQLYKYIDITNKIRDLNFMEQWIINPHLRRRCYEDVMQMNDQYLLKGNHTYDNRRPSYRDKWYYQLKIAVKNSARTVDFECKFGTIRFPDAVWDVLGCMVFKQFIGNDVNSPLVCNIDHIFPLSRIKGGASEFQNLCVLNKMVNSISRKGKYHLFELYEDDKVNGILEGCIRRSSLVAYFNSSIRKNINKQSINFKRSLEETTYNLLVSNGIKQQHIEKIEAVPNSLTNTHVIHVKFNSLIRN